MNLIVLQKRVDLKQRGHGTGEWNLRLYVRAVNMLYMLLCLWRERERERERK